MTDSRKTGGESAGAGGPRGVPSDTPPHSKSALPSRRRTWLETHGRDLRFLMIFGLVMLVYYTASTSETMHERFFPWYLNANARASVGVLKTFGYKDVMRDGNTLSSSRASITVERGCDAAAPSALFVAAVLASPVGIGSRLAAVVGGLIILALVNLIRIISLFLTATHLKSAFDIMHLDVWQAAFIVLSIVLWAVWASWAVKRQRARTAPPNG